MKRLRYRIHVDTRSARFQLWRIRLFFKYPRIYNTIAAPFDLWRAFKQSTKERS